LEKDKFKFLIQAMAKRTVLLTWSASFNVYAAIDLKARVQEGTRVSIDSAVRKVSNGTPASIMASTVE
jgi:hypothetical protein